MNNKNKNNKSSKKKQQKTKERPLNTSFRSGLWLFIKGLIKNNAAYEGGKRPWWNALIIGFLGIMIALIPTMVNYGTSNGSDFSSLTSSPSLDAGYSAFMKDIVLNDIDIEFIDSGSERGIIATDKDGKWKEHYGKYETASTVDRLMPFVYTVDPKTAGWTTEEDVIVYEAYLFAGLHEDNETSVINEAIENLTSGKTIDGKDRPDSYFGTKTITNEEDGSKEDVPDKKMHHSFTIFSTTYFVTRIYGHNGEAKGSYSGNYKKIEAGFCLSELSVVTLEVGDSTLKFGAVANEGEGILDIYERDALNNTYPYSDYRQGYEAGVFSNFAGLYDLGRYTTKWATFWGVTGVTLGIYVLMIFLLGFVIWLTNHGKRNPLRPLPMSLWMKTTAWLCFTPFLLCLFGFFIPEFTPIIFVLTATLRTMWFSFRSLKPGGVINDGSSGQKGQPTHKPLPRGKG